MKTTFVSPAAKKVNWSRLPDRLTEGEVEFSITAWTANARTIAALERQAKRDGYKSVFEYLNVTITSMLLSDEETTLLADDGRGVGGAAAAPCLPRRSRGNGVATQLAEYFRGIRKR